MNNLEYERKSFKKDVYEKLFLKDLVIVILQKNVKFLFLLNPQYAGAS